MENYYKKEVENMQKEAERKEACISNAYSSFLSNVKWELGHRMDMTVLKVINAAFELGLQLGSNDCEDEVSGYSTIEGVIRQTTENPEKRS